MMILRGGYVWWIWNEPDIIESDGKSTWAKLMSRWIKKNGSSGAGHDHVNSANQGHGITCLQFVVSTNQVYSRDATTMPGTTCLPVPPANNECSFTSANYNIPFGYVDENSVNGTKKSVSLEINCKSSASISISMPNGSGTVELKDGNNNSIYSDMSIDDASLSKIVPVKVDAGISTHELTAALRVDSTSDIVPGDYSGSDVINVYVE